MLREKKTLLQGSGSGVQVQVIVQSPTTSQGDVTAALQRAIADGSLQKSLTAAGAQK